MIATILQNSKSFASIDYNENKVKNGVAELVQTSNFGYLDILDDRTSADYKRYFQQWGEKNSRGASTQFHVAISCKGKEYSKDQLILIANQWLKEMGYAGLPTMIYFHKDTQNNHVHIITTRIGENGKKISDSNERYKARANINKVVRADISYKARLDFLQALSYSFNNTKQFEAILVAMGYKTQIEGKNISIYKDGEKLLSKDMKIIDWARERNSRVISDNRKKQLKAIFNKYAGAVPSEKLMDFFKTKFGIGIVLLGKDKPFGYLIIDHKDKCVYKGGDILALKKLMSTNKRIDNIKSIISLYIEAHSDRKEINEILRKEGAYIKGNDVFDKKTKLSLFELSKTELEALNYNNRLAKANSFKSDCFNANVILSHYFKVNIGDINISGLNSEFNTDYYRGILENSFNSPDSKNYLQEYNLKLYQIENVNYLIDIEENVIVDVADLEINQTEYIRLGEEVIENNEYDILSTVVDVILDSKGIPVGGGGVNNELKRRKR